MTNTNKELREDLKNIETYIITALKNQPMDDSECEIHLYNALKEVRTKARISYDKYVFNINENIKERCRKMNEEEKNCIS